MICSGCGASNTSGGISCEYCGTRFPASNNAAERQSDFTEQVVFARWDKRYYYPGIIVETMPEHARVNFLDGDSSTVLNEHIISKDEAFKILDFQGNYNYWGLYYKGVISSYQPLIMSYNDGDVEQIELKQLRGSLRK